MKKYFIGPMVIMAISLIFSTKSCNDIRKDRNRLSDNQTALLKETKFYRTKDSLSAASVQVVTLTKKELKENRPELVKTIKSLGIKPGRTQSISTTALETRQKIKTPVKDSLIYLPGKTIVLKCIDYHSKWADIEGCDQDGQFTGTIATRDSIVQVVHRVPRKFLFIKYGTKAIRQEVVSKNRNSTILYTEYLELKK